MSRSTILHPDDLTLGQFVTVLNGPNLVISYVCDDDGDTLSCQRAVDHSLEGVPLSVLAIDLPYVVVARLNGPGRRVVDVRETELKRITLEYVAALVPALADAKPDCACAVCTQWKRLQEDLKACGGK